MILARGLDLLTQLLNRHVHESVSWQPLSSYQGRAFAWTITEWGTYYWVIQDQKLQFTDHTTVPVVVTLEALLSVWLQILARDGDTPPPGLQVQGDVTAAQDLATWLQHGVDREGILAAYLGDAPARMLSVLAQRVQRHGQSRVQSLQHNTAVWLTDHMHWVPHRQELDEFYQEVDELHLRVQRLAQRCRKLTGCQVF